MTNTNGFEGGNNVGLESWEELDDWEEEEDEEEGWKFGGGKMLIGGREEGGDVLALVEDDWDGVGCGQHPAGWCEARVAFKPHEWAVAHALEAIEEEEAKERRLAAGKYGIGNDVSKRGGMRGGQQGRGTGSRGVGSSASRGGGTTVGAIAASPLASPQMSPLGASSPFGAAGAGGAYSPKNKTPGSPSAASMASSLSLDSPNRQPNDHRHGKGNKSGCAANMGRGGGDGGKGSALAGRGSNSNIYSTTTVSSSSRMNVIAAEKAAMGNVPTCSLGTRRAKRLRHQRRLELGEKDDADFEMLFMKSMRKMLGYDFSLSVRVGCGN